MTQVRAAVVIRGRVQGVWFRQSTKQTADRYAVTGWVRNNPDHSVEAVFEGQRAAVQSVLDWCHCGPEQAQVEEVQLEWQTASGQYSNFQVLR